MTDEVRLGEVDGVADGVQDAVPALHHRLRAHVGRHQVRVLFAYNTYRV